MFITLTMTSRIVTIATEVGADQRFNLQLISVLELAVVVAQQAVLRTAPVDAGQTVGKIYAKLGRWKEAIEQYRLVLTMNPTRAQRMTAEELLGEAYSGQQAYAEAIPHYRAYLQMRPDDASALTHLGIALV